MGDRRHAYRDFGEETQGQEDPGIGRKIILKWTFMECDVETWTGLLYLRILTDGGHL
jgi:hypothetical protein